MTLTRFSSVITLSTTRTSDPASAGIDRFVGQEHIEPENLSIRSWGNIADAYHAFKDKVASLADTRATMEI
jgi:hypothetical protein